MSTTLEQISERSLDQIRRCHLQEPPDAEEITKEIYRVAAGLQTNWSDHERLRRSGIRATLKIAQPGYTIPEILDGEFVRSIEASDR